MHMSTEFVMLCNQQDIHTNDAVEAVINIADSAYDSMWNKLYEQTRILIAKRMSKMPQIESYKTHQKHTKIYPFQCDTVLLEQASQIAINQHQSLASFVRQSIASAVKNYRATSAS